MTPQDYEDIMILKHAALDTLRYVRELLEDTPPYDDLESEKKCKVCGAPAEWKRYGEFYCQVCLRAELDVTWAYAPRVCEMCGDHIDRVYYTDGVNYTFCSAKCALKFHRGSELKDEEEQEDGTDHAD